MLFASLFVPSRPLKKRHRPVAYPHLSPVEEGPRLADPLGQPTVGLTLLQFVVLTLTLLRVLGRKPHS